MTLSTSAPAAAATSALHPHEQLVRDRRLDHPQPWHYHHKLISAPMVRISTLPYRLLAVQHGADIVYSEELIAKKLAKCQRIVNSELHTVEFHNLQDGRFEPSPHTLILSTYQHEPLVVQLGVSNGTDALAAANVVLQHSDCKAIDINMGCPKHFSIQGGMGAALLRNTGACKDIITTLKQYYPAVPITCKIRLLDTAQETITLIKQLQSYGVAAVTVHLRHIIDRPYQRCDYTQLQEILAACHSERTPIVLNGDCFDASEIAQLRDSYNITSVMCARGAMWNPSILNTSQPPLSLAAITQQYLQLAMHYNNLFQNSKYYICEVLKLHLGKSQLFKQVSESKTYEQLQKAVHALQHSELCTAEFKHPVIQWASQTTVSVNTVISTDNDVKQSQKKRKLEAEAQKLAEIHHAHSTATADDHNEEKLCAADDKQQEAYNHG